MKILLTVIIAASISGAFAQTTEAKKKTAHDKEHTHVDSAKMDHEHDEAHHKEHDHKAHHPTHDEDQKKKKH